MKSNRLFLLALLAAVTLALVWLVAPFGGAILWAVIAAVLFRPLYDRLLATMPNRRNTASALMVVVIVAVVVIPAIGLGTALVNEAGAIFASIQSHKIDPAKIAFAGQAQLPDWVREWLAQRGLADLAGLRARLGEGVAAAAQLIAPRILSIGQGTLGFLLQLGVMLYLAFFLLRDGDAIARRVKQAIPLPAVQRDLLIEKFTTAVRATIKGSLIVAALQGTIGGLALWALGIPGALLWGVVMGFFSLFPAIGTGIVWVPMAIYLLATGSVWQGAALAGLGVGVISTVDNFVRPFLVGRDTQMPDYLVLIATLGGFELMGFNGFVLGPVIAALFLAAWEIAGDEADKA